MFDSPVKGKNHHDSFITSLSPTPGIFRADCAGITPCATPPQHCQQEKTVILVTNKKSSAPFSYTAGHDASRGCPVGYWRGRTSTSAYHASVK